MTEFFVMKSNIKKIEPISVYSDCVEKLSFKNFLFIRPLNAFHVYKSVYPLPKSRFELNRIQPNLSNITNMKKSKLSNYRCTQKSKQNETLEYLKDFLDEYPEDNIYYDDE